MASLTSQYLNVKILDKYTDGWIFKKYKLKVEVRGFGRIVFVDIPVSRATYITGRKGALCKFEDEIWSLL